MTESYRRIRAYRHRTATCTRLLFEGYLAPGSHLHVRCPACGGMHLISIPMHGANGDGLALHSTAADAMLDTQNITM
jgi:phage FluMu protein Com